MRDIFLLELEDWSLAALKLMADSAFVIAENELNCTAWCNVTLLLSFRLIDGIMCDNLLRCLGCWNWNLPANRQYQLLWLDESSGWALMISSQRQILLAFQFILCRMLRWCNISSITHLNGHFSNSVCRTVSVYSLNCYISSLTMTIIYFYVLTSVKN